MKGCSETIFTLKQKRTVNSLYKLRKKKLKKNVSISRKSCCCKLLFSWKLEMPSINLPARSFRFFWKLHTICWFKKILLHSTYNIRNFFSCFATSDYSTFVWGFCIYCNYQRIFFYFITDVKKHVSKRFRLHDEDARRI